jgi:hypothetical protein
MTDFNEHALKMPIMIFDDCYLHLQIAVVF